MVAVSPSWSGGYRKCCRQRTKSTGTVVAVALFCWFSVGNQAVAELGDSFTVADSIELTRIVDPILRSTSLASEDFQFSPDEKFFFIVTQKGNLREDTLQYQLRLFSVEEVLQFVNSLRGDYSTLSQVLTSFDSTPIGAGKPRSGGIGQARWLGDSERIAFIGEKSGGPAQVYTVHIETGAVRQLTDHKTHVLRFAVSESNDRLLYVAHGEPPDWTTRNRRGYAVESNVVWDLLTLQPKEYRHTDEEVFLLDLSGAQSIPLRHDSPPIKVARHSGVWISPSGNWAVALGSADDVPLEWLTEYDIYRDIGIAKVENENSPAFSRDRSLLRRYILIDITSGEVTNLLPSPVSSGKRDVYWSSDEQSVVLTNTLLPLEAATKDKVENRRSAVAIVEVDLATRELTVIDSFDTLSGGGRIVTTDQRDDSLLRVRYRQAASTTLRTVYYAKLGRGVWVVRHRDVGADIRSERRLSLAVSQDMNTPPNVIATDSVNGTSRLITALNPTLDHHQHAFMEQFVWTDKNSRTWKGGLLYPPNYDPDERYPLVIQTYGFSTKEYLIDGPRGLTSAFAARPLSSMGIMVLQMGKPDGPPIATGVPTEGPSYVAGFEGAVQELSDRAIVDPTRVGLIGWSRSGLYVSYAVAFSEIEFAAATIADSTSAGYLTHLFNYGLSYPGMVRLERLIGAPYWGENRDLWLQRSPNMNAHRVHTPLRFETYGTYVNPYWDMFALMQRHGRPAEMIHIPLAFHNLRRPQARYTSQQGNVDWFAYWLNGHVDPDPAKAEQYARWNELRTRHHESRQASSDDKQPSSPIARKTSY